MRVLCSSPLDSMLSPVLLGLLGLILIQQILYLSCSYHMIIMQLSHDYHMITISMFSWIFRP